MIGEAALRRVAGTLAGRVMLRGLRANFRRVVWGTSSFEIPSTGPVVLCANHHSFYDGYLLWLLVTQTLGRPVIVWMEDFDRAPIFAPLGAMPFPTDDPAVRARTMRRTAKRMTAHPETVLLFFPEGELRRPDEGLGPFSSDLLTRLSRLLAQNATFWYVGIHITWWGEDRPTAVLASGLATKNPDAESARHLEDAMDHAAAITPDDVAHSRAVVLLEGTRSANERWDLTRLAPLFSRWS